MTSINKASFSRKALCFALALVMVLVLFVPAMSLISVAAGANGDAISVNGGTNTYSLFNSGRTGVGYSYRGGSSWTSDSDPNYDESSYTNGGYDIYSNGQAHIYARLGLSFVIESPVTELGKLTINAYDVDESQDERDYIYLVDMTTGNEVKLSGYLSGMDEQWNTTTFTIDPDLFTVGHEYYFKIQTTDDGYHTFVRTVSVELTTSGQGGNVQAGPTINDFAFSASINGYGEVSTNLYLLTNESVTYYLEYAATVNNDQRGSLLGTSITANSSGVDKNASFYLESGSPSGVYQIDVILKDALGNVVRTFSTTAGYSYSAVSYHSNGGSNNLPTDNNAYVSGDTVYVLFDYIPSKTGYKFLGWSRNANDTYPEFTENGASSFVISSSDVALYAIWEKDENAGNEENGAYNNDGYVLLIEDVDPWASNSNYANTRLLTALKDSGLIKGFDKISSSQVASTSLSDYDVIYIANDQLQSAYNNLENVNSLLEEYAENGGTLIYGASTGGYNSGNIYYSLPGNVTVTRDSSNYNYVADSDHPILTQLYSSKEAFTGDSLYGESINHNYFTNLPANANVILTDGTYATLAEYELGDGHVIVSGLTWECFYSFKTETVPFSSMFFDDLFLYALNVNGNSVNGGGNEGNNGSYNKDGYILLIEDRLPWGYSSNTNLLNSLVSNGHILGYDKISSYDLASVELENYNVVLIAGYQPSYTYDNINQYSNKLISYADNGGSIIYGTCTTDSGSNHTILGGAYVEHNTAEYNYILDNTHPIFTQLYSSKELYSSTLSGSAASHSILTNLPANAKVLLDNGTDATLVEYQVGKGLVILSCLTWEFYYVENNNYSTELYDDLVLYALYESGSSSGHTHSFEETVKAPSCEASGYTTYTCEECGYSYTGNYVNAIGHSFYMAETNEPTCTTDGYILFRCNSEGCLATKEQALMSSGHSFGDDTTCDKCGFYIEPEHTHSFSSQIVEPSCTSVGYTLFTCDDCGYSYKADFVDQKGHRFDEGTVVTEKSCLVDGVIEYTCKNCYYSYETVLPAGHNWVEEITTPKSCYSNGVLTRTCTDCEHTEEEIIPASHDWEVQYEISSPTCTDDGIEYSYCDECGSYAETPVAKLGHHFENSACVRCNATIPDVVTPDDNHTEYGMYFKIDDIVSNYGPNLVNEYGVLLDTNENAEIFKVGVYLVQDGTMWRRCIACVGNNISYATYVPYLSYDKEILYSGLNSEWINIFRLEENADGIWCYSDYTTIGVNLEDKDGNLLLSLYDIGQAGVNTRVFDDLDEMIEWLNAPCVDHISSEWIVDSEMTCLENGFRHKECVFCGEILEEETIYAPGQHEAGDWIIDIEPTATSTGLSHKECSVCGETVETNILPVISLIKIESISVGAGATVTVTVDVQNNPGILGAVLNISFDEGLVLVNAQAGSAWSTLNLTLPAEYTSSCNFVWDGYSGECDGNGTIITLTFQVPNGDIGSVYNITASYSDGDIINESFENVDFAIENGTISIIELKGDVNTDGVVDIADVISLRRYIAGGYGVTADDIQSDMDKDGEITIADVILLRRYIVDGEAALN